MNRLEQPTRARWFLHRAKHHKQSERKVFEAWVSVEARAASKHKHNDMTRKYVKILDSDDNCDEEEQA